MPLHDWPNRATPYINIYINTIHYVTWLQQIGAYWAHLGPTSNKILRRTLNSCNKVTPSCRPPSPFLQPKLIDLEAKWDPSNPIGARGAGWAEGCGLCDVSIVFTPRFSACFPICETLHATSMTSLASTIFTDVCGPSPPQNPQTSRKWPAKRWKVPRESPPYSARAGWLADVGRLSLIDGNPESPTGAESTS